MVTTRYRTTEPISMARASYSFSEDGECQQQRAQHCQYCNHQEPGEDAVAPRLLGGDALERAAQRRSAIVRERAMHEPRNLGQGARPVRRLAPEIAHQAAPADLLAHPALEIGLGRAPQVEVRIELAAESLDIEQRLLQHHELRLDPHVEA